MLKKTFSPLGLLCLGFFAFSVFVGGKPKNDSHGFAPAIALAEAYIPQKDSVVLEHLPSSGKPQIRELRTLRKKLSQDPNNIGLALDLARQYIQWGRAEADPRYDGHAQAVLQPWWNVAHPPPEVLVLRAILRQRRHEFDAALKDLKRAIRMNPHNSQAWLTQAVIYQVRGHYDEARQSCLPLLMLTHELVATTCIANVTSLNGSAQDSYDTLRKVLQQNPSAGDQEQLWALTVLAETAARLGKHSEAEQHFQQALSLDVRDMYLLGAYSDFLLDQNRPADVCALLQNEILPDGLLLRLALAEQQMNAPTLTLHVESLQARFAENRLREDMRHLREEARYTLDILNDPEQALTLAQQNWSIQREPWDARIVLEAAHRSKNPAAAQPVLEWLNLVNLNDVRLRRLIAQLS